LKDIDSDSSISVEPNYRKSSWISEKVITNGDPKLEYIPHTMSQTNIPEKKFTNENQHYRYKNQHYEYKYLHYSNKNEDYQ